MELSGDLSGRFRCKNYQPYLLKTRLRCFADCSGGENAGRTAVTALVCMIAAAREAGADRICFADSVGILLPDETFDVLSLLRREFHDVEFEYHVHNDRGLALANTLSAIKAGVRWHSTSCNWYR